MSQNFELDILVHGSKARTYKHQGRVYVEGKVGSEFTVNIKNNNPQRVLAVLTVDGLSVMDGKEGSYKSGGYIIPAWGNVKVPGWRLSNEEVAAFEFTYPGQSYASKKGKGKNLGIIGCAFYYELASDTTTLFKYVNSATSNDFPFPIESSPKFPKETWPRWPYEPKLPKLEWICRDNERGGDFNKHSAIGMSTDLSVNSLSVSSMMAASAPIQGLGTGFGEKQSHRVNEADFKVATEVPAEVLVVQYDTREGLKHRGVDVDWRPEVVPNPFPKEKRSKDFCEPPRGWNG